MEIYLKTVSGILVAIILIQALSQSEKNTALLLSILVCCMVFTAVGSLFQPVIAFIDKLQDLTNINKNMICYYCGFGRKEKNHYLIDIRIIYGGH